MNEMYRMFEGMLMRVKVDGEYQYRRCCITNFSIKRIELEELEYYPSWEPELQYGERLMKLVGGEMEIVTTRQDC